MCFLLHSSHVSVNDQTQTKKDGFCIRLANSPKNVEKKVINEIRKELDVLTNTYISEKVVEEDHEKSAAQDLKIQMDDKAEELPIVDLIAEAYTQGSITEVSVTSYLCKNKNEATIILTILFL
jgi:hypothetical protein